MKRKKAPGNKQNPLCAGCYKPFRPVIDRNGDTIVLDVKTGKPHTCGRYHEGRYRPAKEANIYHKARLEALEDDPTQSEDTDPQKYGSDVLGALRGFQGRSGRG